MYLRDSLLRLAIADLYRPVWSGQILQELRVALVREGMVAPDTADRMIALIRSHFSDSEVTGYQPFMPVLTCHEKDRHVLAAAISAGVTVIVTDNVADFPPESTDPYDIQVVTADEFLLELLDTAPATVIGTLEAQAGRYKRDPRTLDGLLGSLDRSGLGEFASEVRRLMS